MENSVQNALLTASAGSASAQRRYFDEYRRDKALAAIAHIQRCHREGRTIPVVR